LQVPSALRDLSRGRAPDGPVGADALALYAPLWETLDTLAIDRDEVAAATVFTTGDVVTDLHELSEALKQEHTISLGMLTVDADDGDHERFCELLGTVSFPQFQTGLPPFQQGGVFEI